MEPDLNIYGIKKEKTKEPPRTTPRTQHKDPIKKKKKPSRRKEKKRNKARTTKGSPEQQETLTAIGKKTGQTRRKHTTRNPGKNRLANPGGEGKPLAGVKEPPVKSALQETGEKGPPVAQASKSDPTTFKKSRYHRKTNGKQKCSQNSLRPNGEPRHRGESEQKKSGQSSARKQNKR